MPTVNVNIPRVWRHRGEVDRIHYAVQRPNGQVARLYVDEGHALYALFEEWFATIGYTGPRRGEPDGET